MRFSGLRIAPQWFRMRHYLFLSVPHAVRRYVEKRYDPAEVEAGWHDLRPRLRPEMIKLPAGASRRCCNNTRISEPPCLAIRAQSSSAAATGRAPA